MALRFARPLLALALAAPVIAGFACGAQTADEPGRPDAAPEAAEEAGGEADAAIRGLTVPPPFPAYSLGTCPDIVGGPTEATSRVELPSGKDKRGFNLIVPPSYDGSSEWPLIFGWHWLNASPSSFIDEGQMEAAAEQRHVLIAVPDHLKKDDGDKVYQLDWPFVETWGVASELMFVDDMLACITAKYKVDPMRIYGIGVSAGGLWVTYLSTTKQANHFAAMQSLSGGLGADPTGIWKMKYAPQDKKFASLVLWGGPKDWLALDFDEASKRYRDELRKDHHFVVECTHDAGHAVPPVDPPTNGTRFDMLWTFMLDHPYGTPPDTSPYRTNGLPSIFPSWCKLTP